MIQVSLKRWSTHIAVPSVMAKIRRVIQAHVSRGECVLVQDDGTAGLTDDLRAELERDWPDGKVLFSRTHPVLGGPVTKSPRRPRRKL